MKKSKLFFFLIISLYYSSFTFSQYEELSTKYASNIADLQYDHSIENRIYAHTRGNHLVITHDNSATWNLLHTEINGYILDLKYISSTNKLVFLHENGTQYTLKVFSTETNSVEKTIELPMEYGLPYIIKDFDITEDEQSILINSYMYDSANFGRTKVYKSTNGGESWEIIYDSNESDIIHINKVKIDPTNSTKYFLGRGVGFENLHGGLWISTNSGQNWVEHFKGLTINTIEFHPTHQNEIWIGSGDNVYESTETQLYKSLNGGENWELMEMEWSSFEKNSINGIAFHPNDPNYIVIFEEDEIATSTDGGITWHHEVELNPKQSTTGSYLATKPNWNPFNVDEYIGTGRYHPFIVMPINKTMIKNNYFRNYGNLEVVKTPNNTTYVYYGNNFGRFEYNDVININNHLSSYPNRHLFDYYDPVSIIDKKFYGRMYMLEEDFYYIDGELRHRRIFYVRKSFYDSNPTIVMETPLAEINQAVTFPSNPNKFFASLSDFGYNPKLHRVDITNPNSVEITDISLPLLFTGRVNYVEFNENNPDEILIAQRARLYRTIDAGQNWTEINQGLEDLVNQANSDMMDVYDHILKVQKDPFNENNYWMTTTKGVYRSEDGANSWVKILDQSMQNVFLSNKTEGHIILYSATTPNSILKLKVSSDGGNNWVDYNIQIDYHIRSGIGRYTSDVLFDEESAKVFIGTEDIGIIVFSVDFENLSISDPIEFSTSKPMIYPNPAKDFIQVDYKNEIKEVFIYSLNGKQVLHSFKNKIDVSSLPEAVYVVKILDSTGEISTNKFIKK